VSEFNMDDKLSFDTMSKEEKRIELYLSQKRLLETFLERNAISRAQYEKSLSDLTTKMHMEEYR
jgi:hypothetical protein